MENYLQPGNTITVVAPEDVVAGEGFFIGDLFHVACKAASSGDDVEAMTSGVFSLTKATGSAFTAGDPAIFDVSADKCDAAATDTADRSCGIVIEDAASGDTTVKVLINRGGALVHKGGVYTMDAEDDTDNVALIDTGLSVILGFSVLLTTSGNVENGSDAVITKSGGNISVADGATTYDCTAGFKVTWTAVGY